jgi:hypothetical protein
MDGVFQINNRVYVCLRQCIINDERPTSSEQVLHDYNTYIDSNIYMPIDNAVMMVWWGRTVIFTVNGCGKVYVRLFSLYA